MITPPPFRIGQGWDTHRLEPGRDFILGGVKIPSEFGLAGHSDADVLAHAITDAILGALSLGDIGLHFPDTDPQWRSVNSIRFLLEAQRLAAQQGYSVSNIDSTVILERPKLKDFRSAIRENLASVLKIDVSACSLKFKTAENVGPVGEGRSCEAQAVVLLQLFTSSAK
jgi:2-C-methyl-D-erythritol 2,4-cyclodiphosphate synthase